MFVEPYKFDEVSNRIPPTSHAKRWKVASTVDRPCWEISQKEDGASCLWSLQPLCRATSLRGRKMALNIQLLIQVCRQEREEREREREIRRGSMWWSPARWSLPAPRSSASGDPAMAFRRVSTASNVISVGLA